MSDLSNEQKAFLEYHRIDLNQIFNAQGLPQSQYKVIMKELNKSIAFNVSSCRKNGHSLRTRSGHCIQCNSAAIEFQNRSNERGIIYIAGSINGGLLKVGFSKSESIRENSLNRTNYASQTDWKVLFIVKSDNAGRLELEVHKSIQDSKIAVEYDHDGHQQISNETFRLNYSDLKLLILEIANERSILSDLILDINSNNFEFSHRIINIKQQPKRLNPDEIVPMISSLEESSKVVNSTSDNGSPTSKHYDKGEKNNMNDQTSEILTINDNDDKSNHNLNTHSFWNRIVNIIKNVFK